MGQEDASKKGPRSVDPESYFLKKKKLQAQVKLANKAPLTEAEKQAKKAAKKLKKKEKKIALRASKNPGASATSVSPTSRAPTPSVLASVKPSSSSKASDEAKQAVSAKKAAKARAWKRRQSESKLARKVTKPKPKPAATGIAPLSLGTVPPPAELSAVGAATNAKPPKSSNKKKPKKSLADNSSAQVLPIASPSKISGQAPKSQKKRTQAPSAAKSVEPLNPSGSRKKKKLKVAD